MRIKSFFDVKPIFYSKQSDISALNGIRALSVFWVISHHYLLQMQVIFTYPELTNYMENLSWPLAVLMHGDLGVDIFFILSGFLLTVSILGDYEKENNVNFKRFYMGRFLRLTPAYMLAIILYYPFLPNRENLWANLLQINNFLSFDNMYMVWTWSLAVQEQFYLLLPLFLLFFITKVEKKLLFLISLFLLSFFLRFVAHFTAPGIISEHPTTYIYFIADDFSTVYFDKIYVNLYTRYGPMLLGVIFAYLHLYHREKMKQFFLSDMRANVLILLAIFGFVWFLTIPHFKPSEPFSEARFLWYSVFSNNLFALSVGVLMLAVINSHWATRPLERFLRLSIWHPVAQISYSMYLFQMLFIASIIFYATSWLKKNPVEDIYQFADLLLMAGFPVALLLTMLFSLVIAVLVERPFMNLRKHPKFRF